LARFSLFGGTPSSLPVDSAVAVIGLGRFGQSLALELMTSGVEVLGIDTDEAVVQSLNARLTHVVRADAGDEDAMRQLGVPQLRHVVVAIGSHLESSILATSLLLRLGVPNIWAKAVSDAHGTILEQLGVPHVVYPEQEMGRRVAHLVQGKVQDFVEIERDYAIVKTHPPRSLIGVRLAEANVRRRCGVTVIASRRPGGAWQDVTPETVLDQDDLVLVTGNTRFVEAFAQLE
jgi:trk system potassium uptake protein